MSSWKPLTSFLHGKMVKAFLPCDKHANLPPVYTNIYPGDDIYVFETQGDKWGRAYVATFPFPHEFSVTTIDLDRLPEPKIIVAIIPLSHMRLIEEIPVTDNDKIFLSTNSHALTPTILDIELGNDAAVNGQENVHNKKKGRPPLPILRVDHSDLPTEISAAIVSLNNHIYALYAMGEFNLFHKLTHLYNELDELRIKITYTLCTSSEMEAAFKFAAVILGKISKLLGLRDLKSSQNNFTANSDTQGYEAILARDANTGEMFDKSNHPTPAIIAANQLLFALTPNYPITDSIVSSLAPYKNKKLIKVPPSHILVDFKEVEGEHHLTPSGFSGMTAYLYLRSQKKRLTEAFAIHIDPSQQFSLENLSAALFKNIPATEIDTGRIYLVAVLTEDIIVNKTIRTIKQGIAAGVTDISRIFSRHKGALASGEAHKFNIRLYGSHFANSGEQTAALVDQNNGWGELVDRIISGSNKGIAINPRARKLTVSVKEFKNELIGDDYEVTQTKLNSVGEEISSNPIAPIRSFYYDPLGKNYERVYMRVGKVQLLGAGAPRDAFVTIEISTSNRHVSFAKGTNQKPEQTWRFVSTRCSEAVGEIIKINGIEHLSSSDERVKITCYVNGDVYGTNTLKIKESGYIVVNENGLTFEMHSSAGQPTASVELYTEYIGKTYNIDAAVKSILTWESNPATFHTMLDILSTKFRRIELSSYIKYFPELVCNLLKLLKKGSDDNTPALQKEAFQALVHLLDVVVARQDQYVYLFDSFVEQETQHSTLPLIGHKVCLLMGEVFKKADTEWNHVGRALCRVASLLCQISVMATAEENATEFVEDTKIMLWSCNRFLKMPGEGLIADQILILDVIDYCYHTFAKYFPRQRIAYIVKQTADALGTRGLGTKDATSAVTKKRSKEHGLVIAKMLLIRRLLDSWLLDTAECRNILIVDALDWALQVLTHLSVDVDAARLANGVLARIFTIVWDEIVTPEDKSGDYICYGIARLLPALSKIFNVYLDYCRNNGLFKAKRTFSQLFPCEYPFKDITMDSMVNAEVFVEVLMEMATLFAFSAKIGAYIAGEAGFVGIFAKISPLDEIFVSDYYIKVFADNDIYGLIRTVKHLNQAKFFPRQKWLSLHAVLSDAGVTAFELLKRKMLKYYIPSVENSEQFNRSLWGNYLKTLFRIGHSMPVSICHLSEIPRKGCWKITGDIRDRVAVMVEDCWAELGWDSLPEDYARFHLAKVGGYQSEFIVADYGILQDLIFYSLQRHTHSQSLGVDVLWSLIVSELLVSENLLGFEKECIIGLYDIYHSENYKPGRYEQKNLIKFLKSKRVDPEDESYPVIHSFINSLAEFLEILDHLNNVPLGDEFDDDRTSHKLNIKGLLMNVEKPELLQSFINEMYENNIAKSNYIQAALSMKLLADTIDWSVSVMLPASYKPDFPAQSSFKRKEALFNTIAVNYVKGNRYEKALEIYLELCEAHNTHTLDLKSLSDIHHKLSKIYADLESLDRLTPSYFRIAFIGSGFPKSIRGKQYIYEGLPFEHITSIHQRLLKIHPGARIITTDEEAKSFLANEQNGRYLHITTVEPSRDINTNFYSLGHKRFAENKDLKFFTVKKRLPGSTSVLDFWSEETTYESEKTFPTLMNRSVIANIATVKLSPIENALRSFSDKIGDLRSVFELVKNTIDEGGDTSVVFGELSRQCSGTIDSPVNGGVHQYKLFFKNTASEDPNYAYQLELLRSGFTDLAIILNRLLTLHGKLVPVQLKASHNSMVELFHKNFKDELDELKNDPDYDGSSFMDRFVGDRSSVLPSTNSNMSLLGRSMAGSSAQSLISGSSGSSVSRRNGYRSTMIRD
ncbi:hypothetical protein BABINDRAFT_162531 [Babjeviella inositovora NRRL Y-12698]|uniref:DOCKER domain-containing protein n=1 Tax=Babjeviella inositovora NRRL Y-12698 TaxID=984486 RepID=A0A1E3QMJ8_9ASCO|nr:uncharacterized protein BABINDRAFT_162531 [Babjeviella inositovora NRRL Y-12698]ODQ78858.1 hypothetical protein BABINDRAFT_162531 [Babjeviella inositovora NRRL Y-12698]